MKKTHTIFKSILRILWLVALMTACDENEKQEGGNSDITPGATDSNDSNADSNSDSETSTPVSECGPLFGIANGQTGLDSHQCQPTCNCNGAPFTPTTYTAAQIDNLATTTLLNPPTLLSANPYDTPDAYQHLPNQVCGLRYDATDTTTYRLDTYASAEAATSAGASITHHGACGLCSSLDNLAVYLRYPDLTSPVRQCGIEGFSGGEKVHLACLKNIGFNDACAQIWYYNTLNTRTLCLSVCASALSAPYHTTDGQINECLQCDEDNSGPVFKAVAGRTRRNSGLPTAICRPCETVAPVTHDYLK